MENIAVYDEARAAQDALEAAMHSRRPARTGTPLPRVEVKAVAVGGEPRALPRPAHPVVAVKVDQAAQETPVPLPTPRIPTRPVSLPVVEETWAKEVEASATQVEEYTPAAITVAMPSSTLGVIEGEVAVDADDDEEGRVEAREVSSSPSPRKRKRPARRTIKGTDRDRVILNRLVLVGMSTTAIMTDLVHDGSTVRAIEKRMYEMQAAGLTRRIPGVWNCPSVWVPTRKGVGLSRYPEAPVRSASDLPWTTAVHELKIAEVIAALRTGRLGAHVVIPAGSVPMTGRLIEAAYNRKGALVLDASATLDDYLEAPESLALIATEPGKGFVARFPDVVILRPGMTPLYIEVERSIKRGYEYDDLMPRFYAPTGGEVLYLVGAPAIGSAVTRAARKAGMEIVADAGSTNALGTTMRVEDMDLSWLV